MRPLLFSEGFNLFMSLCSTISDESSLLKFITFKLSEELTILLRNLRESYWNEINENQECYIAPEVGPCEGICPTFYFNQETGECEEFITGCCGVEAFDLMESCQELCE